MFNLIIGVFVSLFLKSVFGAGYVRISDGITSTIVPPSGCFPVDCVSYVEVSLQTDPAFFILNVSAVVNGSTIWGLKNSTGGRFRLIGDAFDIPLASVNPPTWLTTDVFNPVLTQSSLPEGSFSLIFIATELGKYSAQINIPINPLVFTGQIDFVNGSIYTITYPFTVNYRLRPASAFSGDPYYKTLDGLKYKYDGPCSYLLLSNEECPGMNENYDNKFSIVTHHGRCRSRRKNVVCIKSLSATINKKHLEITSNNELLIDGELKEIPYKDNDLTVTPRKHEYTKKNKMYTDYFVETNWGLSFVFSNEGTGTGYIESIPEGMQTCGLLGNKNGNKNDDIQLHDGQVLISEKDEEMSLNIIRMGDDWMVPTYFQPLRCDWYAQESYASTKMCRFRKNYVEQVCDMMVNNYSHEYRGYNIEKCFPGKDYRQVDATRIYDDCVTEICACGEDDISQCEPIIALATMKNSCLQNGASRKFPRISFTSIVQMADQLVELPEEEEEDDEDDDIVPRILQ